MAEDITPTTRTILRIDHERVNLAPLDLDPEAFQSPLPVQNHHLIFEDEAIGLAVGIWDTTTMQEAFGPYPGDEFITVLNGSFAILDGDGAAVTGTRGQSATFRNGIPVSWKQDGYLRKIYLTLTPPDAPVPQISSAAGGIRVLPGNPPPYGEPDQTLFRNDTGTMSVEFRCHGATSHPAAPTTIHELCRVLSGELVLTDIAGVAHHFGAGSHVFMPEGTVVARATREGTAAYHVLVTA